MQSILTIDMMINLGENLKYICEDKTENEGELKEYEQF